MLPLDRCVGRLEVGSKAEVLARARAAGLPVADGVVLLPEERIDLPALQTALAHLGGERFAVRSSASVEDGAQGSAAGLFTSIIGVRSEDVPDAIAAVRRSATGAVIEAYLEARHLEGTAIHVAVLIQPAVEAERYGVAHSRGDHFVLEERVPGEPEWGDVQSRTIRRDETGPLVAGLRTLEEIVGGPVDAELARSGGDVTWLQARPLVVRVAPGGTWRLDEPGHWRRDAEHNPDPLSTAQASLVAFVEQLGVGARQRVVGRYLYVERGAPRALTISPFSRLRQQFDEEIQPACSRVLAAAQDGGLDAALDAYAYVYRRYVGEVSPSLADARTKLDSWLRAHVGEPLSSHGALLAGLGGATLLRDHALWRLGRAPTPAAWENYWTRFGDHAPAWDVAVPTDREAPQRVQIAASGLAASSTSPIARHARAIAMADAAAQTVSARLVTAERREFAELLQAVREALPVAEDDDLLFLSAQATVRRALLAATSNLGLTHPDEVFELTLDEVRQGRAPGSERRVEVAARKREREQAGRQEPPESFHEGQPVWPLPQALEILRGTGIAGHARGRAVVVRALAAAPPRLPANAVLVVAAIIPSLTPLLLQARALVTDHGGALSHGATLAREYGLPAVLGVGRATALAEGTELWVDGDTGRVYVLD